MNKETMNNQDTNETAIATVNAAEVATADMMAGLMNPGGSAFFSSIPDTGDRASKVKIYNAANAATNKLDDEKGQVINAVDVVAHTLTLPDENSGELVDCVRVVIMDDQGVGHVAVSQGIVSSLQKIFQIVGMPTWNPPLPMKVVEQKTRKGFKTNTLELV